MVPGHLGILRAVGSMLCASSIASAADFYRDVFPFLENNCVACHNKTTSKGGLNMETPADLRKGGDSGPGIVLEKPDQSPVLLSALHQGEAVMPPKNNKSGARDLTPAEIQILLSWIREGAKDSVKPSRQIVWKTLPAGVAPIHGIALSPDGRLALCARGNRLFAYDPDTRAVLPAPEDPVAGAGPRAAHRSLIRSCAFSPDGSLLATGSYREVKLWRRTPAPASTARLESGRFLALLANGAEALIVGNDLSLAVAALPSYAVRRSFGEALVAKPTHAALSPDGKRVALVCEDGAVQVRDIEDGKVVWHTADALPVHHLTWSGNSEALVLAANDGQVRIYSPAADGTSAPALELRIAEKIRGLHPSKGHGFAVWTANNTVRIHSASKPESAASIPVPPLTGFAVNRDGSRAALGLESGVVRILEMPAATVVADLKGDHESSRHIQELERAAAREALEISFQKSVIAKIETENKNLENHTKRKGDLIATAKKSLPDREKAVPSAKAALEAARKDLSEAEAALAEAADPKASAPLNSKLKEALNKVEATQKALISAETLVANSINQVTDGEAHLARIEATKKQNTERTAKANAVITESTAKQSEADAKLARIKDSASKVQAPIALLAFSADGSAVYAADARGSVRAWATATARPLPGQTTTQPAHPVALCHNGERSVCILEDGTALWGEGFSRWTLARTLGGATDSPLAERVNAVSFSPDGKTLATGSGELSRSGDIHLWDTVTGKLVSAWRERHRDAVLALDFSPDGTLLVSGGADRLAKVTEIATGKPVFLFEAHTHQVCGAVFRSDGRVVATGGADGVVNIWDMELGERKKKLTLWKKEITSLQFLGATNQILTSSGDNQIRIVTDEAAEIKTISNLPDFMQAAAAVSPTGLIVGGGEDSALRIWDAPSGKELATLLPIANSTP